LPYWPQLYHLHRTDGSDYPWEQLPVCRALKEGRPCLVDDIVVHRPHGKQVPLMSWAAPVELTKLGQADAAVWVLEDLSALRSAESAARQARDELQRAQRVELIGRLAGGTIHDFNNLLTVITSVASLARVDLLPSDPLQGHLDRILQAGEHAAGLVAQLL